MKTKNTIGPAELISEAVNTITTQLTEALTLLVHRRGEVAERAEAIKVPAKRKAKAKPKAKLHPYAHNGVKLTAREWTVWVAVKALFDAKEWVVGPGLGKGFYSLSGQFVAQFIGLPYWEKQEVDRVNSTMASLRRKGLLTWVNERIGKRGRKLKGDIALGPNA